MRLKKVAVVAKPHAEEAGEAVRKLVQWLKRHDIAAVVEERTAERAGGRPPTFAFESPPADPDLMIVLGGDGTLLAAARAMDSRQVPILGVNLGSLGFLTDVTPADLYATLEEVRAGRCVVETRMMLDAELVRRGSPVARKTVLNDVVVTKGAIARIIELSVSVNDQFMAVVRADGIIVSTPTGSTAYSLAAGGPILHPSLDAMVLTPICPHTLTHRPVVIPDRATVEVTLRGAADEVYASFDGQFSQRMESGDDVRLQKSRSAVKLIRPVEKNYFQVLRHKLRWGERPRARGR